MYFFIYFAYDHFLYGFSPVRQDLSNKFGCPVWSGDSYAQSGRALAEDEILAWNFTSLSSCVSNRNARHMGKNLHLQAIIINSQMGGSSLWLLTNEFFKLLIIGPSQAKNNYSFVFPSWFNPGGHPYMTSLVVLTWLPLHCRLELSLRKTWGSALETMGDWN